MQIRRLEKEEIEDAILFATRKKPEDFMQILNRCMRDQLFYWGYYEGEQLCGVIAATCEGFLTTLYVSPGKSRQLMQKQLLEYAGHILKSIYEVNQITVTVDIKEQAGYEQLGFESILTDRAMEENGQALISLKYTIRPTTITQGNVQKTFDKRKVAVIIGIIVVVLAIIGGIIWYYESQDTGGTGGILPQIQEPKEEEDVEPTQTAEAAGVGDEDYKSENVEDITKVEPYIGTDVTYGVKTDTYEMKEDKDTVNLDFQAQYPVLEQLSGEYAEQINTLIQNTALSTVNLLYLNPTEDTKALWADEEKPYLYSHVKYQITYMNNNVMSIVFEDHYYMGDTSSEYLDLRTLNINLKTGTVYSLKDIVNLNETFQKSWYYRMTQKSPESWVLPELSTEDCKNILTGADTEGRYWDEFFLHKGGIEVGFTYHHQGTKGISRGWLTCKYSYKEMKTYKTDSDFWNYVTNE